LRIAAALMTVVITAGVVLTFSRGAAVGLVVLLLALIVLRVPKREHIIAIGLGLAVIFAAFPQYWTRISSIAALSSVAEGQGTGQVDTSVLSRATETLAAGLAMVDHPLVGVGPGMFPFYYEAYANIVGIEVKNDANREAHNLYLGIGAELGLPGLIVFLGIVILIVRMLLEARRRSLVRRPDLERLTTPFLLAILTYHVTGLFLHLSFARYYWMILAIATAAALITLREMDRMDEVAAQEPYSQSV
jgi:O-antigen ligase